MDHIENTPASAEVNNDTLSMINELRGSQEGPKPEAGTLEPAETPAAEKPAEKSQEEIETDSEERRNALLREIAGDPALTQQYAQQQYHPQQQEQYYPQYQPQQQEQYQQQYYPRQQEQEAEPYVLPFDNESYDPFNLEHQHALVAYQMQQTGAPLFEAIQKINERFQQEEQSVQSQQLQAVVDHANQKTVEFLDTYVPGFSGIAEKIGKGETLTTIEKAVFNEAVNAESAFLQENPHAAYDVRARAQIAQKIGPQLKEYAREIGLVAQPKTMQLTPEQKQVMKQEMYVESSNAVPAPTAGSFQKALAAGDSLQMIRALRQQ